LLSLFCGLMTLTIAAADRRPNILFIMADDHSAGAISAYGSKVNRTPNLDRLANQGMKGSVEHIPIFNLRQFSGSWKGSRELPCSGAGLSARKPQYCSSFCPDRPAIVSFFRPALPSRCKPSTVHRRRANSSSRMRWPFCWFVSFPNRCQS
jgi:hypothetical protein